MTKDLTTGATRRRDIFHRWSAEVEDDAARARGLQVARKRLGKRAYRDPRFDALRDLSRSESGDPLEPATVDADH